MTTQVEVHSDGSGGERAGRPGGWAFVVVRGDEVLARGEGRAGQTTCLLMELEAARAGLAEVLARGWHAPHGVVLVCDSSIVLDVAAGRFLPKPRAVQPAALALRAVATQCQLTTRWVRAHAGQRWNELVDARARAARLG